MASVSIITPSFNATPFVADAIRSALANDSVVEVIVQDGGSTDGTLDVLSAIRDPRLHIVSEADTGQSEALNRAVARATGDWFLWLNADDLLVDGSVDAVSRLLDDEHDLVYGDFALIDAHGEQIRRYYCPSSLTEQHLLVRGTRVFSGSILARRELYAALGGFDESLARCMDYEWLLRASRVARARHAPMVVGLLRVHNAAKSSRDAWQFLREHRVVQRRHLPQPLRVRGSMYIDNARMAAAIMATPLRYSSLWRRLRSEKKL